MWNKHVQGILVVQHHELVWMAVRECVPGPVVLRLPIEHLLADPSVVQNLPPPLRGNGRTICIAPDHWFGMESFAFQSRKASLVEPFLARKLSTLHPEHALIRQFFSYEWIDSGQASRLISYFLVDEKAYALWSALLQVEQAPLRIISPALVWQAHLGGDDPDFEQRGTLLVHLFEDECNLCFYSMGAYVFSRNVTLPNGPERIDVLTFEINQSLHLFTQRTKGELARIYLQSDARLAASALSARLGREVVALETCEPSHGASGARTMTLLHGMLRPSDMLIQHDGLGIFHRETRQALRWAPVQWYGIGLGSILAAGLACELSMLGGVLDEESRTQQSLLHAASTEGLRLSELETAAQEVLQLRDRPACADTLSRLLASFPRQMRVRETTLNLEGQRLLSVNASVQVNGTIQLESLLQDFVSRVRSQGSRLSSFSLNNIDVQPTHTKGLWHRPAGQPDRDFHALARKRDRPSPGSPLMGHPHVVGRCPVHRWSVEISRWPVPRASTAGAPCPDGRSRDVVGRYPVEPQGHATTVMAGTPCLDGRSAPFGSRHPVP